MPIYEYRAKGKGCEKCSNGFEVMQGIREDPLSFCPQCHGQVVREISRIGRIEVAYTPSDAFKHYTKQLEERERKREKEMEIKGEEDTD
jgi:putative FmdB family regulatory protein